VMFNFYKYILNA